MPDFRPGSGQGPESLDDIARTDQLLDALAGQRRVRPADRADAELFALLEDWRDGVRGPSVRRFITEDEAAVAIQDGLAAQTPKPRPRRALTVVASLAAGVLAIGGFGALVGGAQPGDSMYGLRTALFGESPSVRDDRVTLAAQTEMAEVQQLIERGDWEQAQAKLEQVSTSVQTVGDVEHKADLIQQWNELSVKVGTRDPQATLPPVTPGAPAVPPPPGVTLLELPAPVAPTTTAPSDPGTVPAEDEETTVVPGETTEPTTGPADPTTEPAGPTTDPAEPGVEPTTGPSAEPTEPGAEPTTEPAAPTSSAAPSPTPTPSSAPRATSTPAPSTTPSAPPVAEAPEPAVTTVPTSAVVIESSRPEEAVPAPATEPEPVEAVEEAVTTTPAADVPTGEVG
ncbi:anti-sigma-D factor RsdA [[Mycobacterium] wendilense]|uniref:Anti-sigma-D factor RsdA n=1 Tax=[Mycobacterium] wendilense TaxID=3064284 RepID=A0ABM9MH40_9MYCO|nr:anti-sigma-D factor RsdA [Mycolicibacterium sp. MU0050]CAJ1585080.1 anti-sigma-D factor RsdA [Mycolicibacterium sp. MU0050]